MMIGAIGFGELMLILLAAVLVLGPDKAPQTARQLGKIVREFRQTMNGMTDDLKETLSEDLDDDSLKEGLKKIRENRYVGEENLKDFIKEPTFAKNDTDKNDLDE